MSTKTYRRYLFTVTGGFHVDADWFPSFDCSGNIMGFEKPDGTVVDIAVCLRTENSMGEKFQISEKQMEKIGFESLDYDRAEFVEIHEED